MIAHDKKGGIIPYIINNDTIYMMFMIPSHPAYGGTSPQIAKGGIGSNEDHFAGSLREGQEELGIIISNINYADGIIKIVEDWIIVYALSMYNRDNFNHPHWETGSVHWLTMEQFKKKGRKTHIGIVEKLYEKIIQN